MQPEAAPPDAKLTPAALKAQGLDQFNRGDREEALVTFQKAAEAFVTAGDTAGAAEMYNKRIQDTKETLYWNTGVCWKCGQTMETDSEYCWECGTKYKVRK